MLFRWRRRVLVLLGVRCLESYFQSYGVSIYLVRTYRICFIIAIVLLGFRD